MSSSIALETERRQCRPLPIAQAYEAHADALRRFAGARMRDSVGAEDIIQEAFLRLARESSLKRYPRQPNAWLHRVAANLITSGARHALVARRYSIAQAVDDEHDQSPEDALLARERCRQLGSAMRSAARDGQIALLLAAEGHTGREIAGRLGRTEGATRTPMTRARHHVRRALTSAAAGLNEA